MLTNIYYYNFYRPYIVGTEGQGNGRRKISTHEKPVQAQSVKDDYDVYLNKSLKKDVINYAKDIYTSITDLKMTSKALLNDLNTYKRYGWHNEFNMPEFSSQFDSDVANYVSAYNSSSKFLDEQTHSSGLRSFADGIKTDTQRSSRSLNRAGIRRNEEGLVTKDGENISAALWQEKGVMRNVGNLESYLSRVYTSTTDVLGTPMSNHMNFKSLNYYYNYKIANVQVDTFQIINTGLLVNLAL